MRVALVGDPTDVHVRRWLGALADRGHEVHHLSGRPADVPGVRWRETPLYAWHADPWRRVTLALRGAREFRRALREIRPDVFHAYGLFPLLAWSVAPALAGIAPPRVFTVLGSDVIPRGADPEPGAQALLKRWLLGRAERVTASSEYLAAHVRRYVERPVTISAPGVAVREWTARGDGAGEAGAAAFAARRGGAFVIGFCKRLLRGYGADLLVRAVGTLVWRGIDARLLIVGDGPERAALEALAREGGVADRIEWAGAVPHARLPEYYRRMDVFCMPTRIDEALGVSALEAQAMGVPVVAARIGGIPEAVAGGVTGLLVPPEDPGALAAALERLAHDPGLRQSLGAAGPRAVAERFDWDRHVARLEGVYRDAVAERRGRRRDRARFLFLHFGDLQEGRISPQVEEKLRLLRGRGLQIRAVVPGFGPPSAPAADVHRASLVDVRGLRGPSYALSCAWETRRAIAAGAVDAVFTRFSPWCVPAYGVARLARLPVIAELHGTHDEVLRERGWRAWPARLLGQLGLRLIDAGVVGSEAARAHFRRWLGARPTLVLSNGAPAALADPVSHARSRAVFGFPASAGVVLHLGTLGEYFPEAATIEAIRLGAARDPRLLWVFAGTGLEGVRARVEAAGLGAHVRFLGWIAPERVRELAAACDAGALLRTAAWDEISGPAPLKLFTYMACALPVIATRVAGVAATVERTGCGILVPPDDPAALAAAIERVLADREAAARMGRNGRIAFRAEFTWERLVERLAEFLKTSAAR